MKEIDTEISVVWPSWCYSDNLPHNVLKECLQLDKDYHHLSNSIVKKAKSDQKREPVSSLATIVTTEEKKMLSERSLLLSGYSKKNTIDSVKVNNLPLLAQAGPAVQATGLTLTPTTTAAAAAAYLYLEKVKNERMSPRVTVAQLDSLKDAIMESSSAAAVAAAKVNNNNINNNSNSMSNNTNNGTSNSNINTVSGTTSSTASNCSNNSIHNNNLVNSQVQNSFANSAVHNTSDDLQSHSLTQSSNQTQQQRQIHKHQNHRSPSQQQQQSAHMSSNNVKKERLSPGTNGELLTSLSRSRSTTPSSFRGTSPQQSIQSSPSETLIPMHNLSTNLLNSIHQAAAASTNRQSNLGVQSSGISSANSSLPTDFSTRNYSDFMRSLAAKYNNTNDNLKRNNIFEATANNTTQQKKTLTAAQKASSYASTATTPINKEVSITTTSSLPPPPPLTSVAISPGESAIKLTQQNKFAAAVANAAAACSSNVSPYMTSFLSSLPFSPGLFPPLIDMSNTQALIILARAAKENEIHNILSASSLHQKRSSACISPAPSPSLNIALQQAAQFISPALIYSTQLQKQQLQHQQQVSRQSSPRLANISNSTPSGISAKTSRNQTEKISVSPLDLSSQPPAAKRFKAESTSSHSSADGLINTIIVRRASSSTATTSPSPPPFNEKFSIAATTTDNSIAPINTDDGLNTKTEATTTAPFMPIKAVSSTLCATSSSSSSIAPAVAGRQCQAQSEELNSWTVDDVCAFVGSIDICAEYVKHFRDQCIDGSGLPLLTEDHLVNSLGMKLGPALKLRSVLAKKLGGPCPCVSCVAQVQQVLALQTGNITTTSPAIVATTTPIGNPVSGTTTKIFPAIGSSGNTCNSYLQENSLTVNCDMSYSSHKNNNNNNSANQNESAETSSANAISTNTTTDHCTSTGKAVRSSSGCNTNIGNFSSPSPQHEQHHNQEQFPSQNICNSSSKNISSDDSDNLTINRHDNVDSSNCS